MAVTWSGGGGPAASRDSKVSAAHVFLCADICEEFGEAGLCIQPRREQQGTGTVMLATELRMGTAFLEEDGHNLEGILCQGLLRVKRPRGRANILAARDFRDWIMPDLSCKCLGSSISPHSPSSRSFCGNRRSCLQRADWRLRNALAALAARRSPWDPACKV